MTSPIEREAELLVAELAWQFQARFELCTCRGPHPRWYVEPGPGLRKPMLAFLDGFDRDRPGFDRAMVRAILVTKQMGAR